MILLVLTTSPHWVPFRDGWQLPCSIIDNRTLFARNHQVLLLFFFFLTAWIRRELLKTLEVIKFIVELLIVFLVILSIDLWNIGFFFEASSLHWNSSLDSLPRPILLIALLFLQSLNLLLQKVGWRFNLSFSFKDFHVVRTGSRISIVGSLNFSVIFLISVETVLSIILTFSFGKRILLIHLFLVFDGDEFEVIKFLNLLDLVRSHWSILCFFFLRAWVSLILVGSWWDIRVCDRTFSFDRLLDSSDWWSGLSWHARPGFPCGRVDLSLLTLFNQIFHKIILLMLWLQKLVLIAVQTLCNLLFLRWSYNLSSCFWGHLYFDWNSLSWRSFAFLNIYILVRNTRIRIRRLHLFRTSLLSWLWFFLFKIKIDIDCLAGHDLLNLSLYEKIPFSRVLVPDGFPIFVPL